MNYVKYAVYDCQICGVMHEMKAEWTRETEEEFTRVWEVSMLDELVDQFVRECIRELKRIHGDLAVFVPERLGFSLTEEIANEK